MSVIVEEDFKRWTAKRKAALVMDIIQGKTSVSEASRSFDLPPSEIELGTRSSFGLFVDPISGPAGFDFSREAFAMVLALQNLFWGIGQPIAGALGHQFDLPAAVGQFRWSVNGVGISVF